MQGEFAPIADYDLLNKAATIAKKKRTKVKVGNIVSSDIFYNLDDSANDGWRNMGVLAVDMEAAALYMNAANANKKALCLLTISDHIYKKQHLDSDQRQIGFKNMIEIALELI